MLEKTETFQFSQLQIVNSNIDLGVHRHRTSIKRKKSRIGTSSRHTVPTPPPEEWNDTKKVTAQSAPSMFPGFNPAAALGALRKSPVVAKENHEEEVEEKDEKQDDREKISRIQELNLNISNRVLHFLTDFPNQQVNILNQIQEGIIPVGFSDDHLWPPMKNIANKLTEMLIKKIKISKILIKILMMQQKN